MEVGESKLAVGFVFAAAAIVYLVTLCPTVYGGDSGDFITASYTLGVSHPTGYPLYMLLGKVFSFIPVGGVAYRYNLMSALFAAATAVVVCVIVHLLTKSWKAGAGAGLMVAFSTAVWDQATVAEAYMMNGFFTAVLLLLALKWREEKTPGLLLMFAAAYGLALTNHVSAILYAPAFAYLVSADRDDELKKVDLEKAAAYFAAPLLLYLYIPLAASRNPAYNWGDPGTPGRFINHVTGFVHRQTYVLTLTTGELIGRLSGLIFHYLRQYSLAGALVAGGLYSHGGGKRKLLNYTILMVAADLVYALFLNNAPLEATTFSIPSIIVLGVWGGFGLTEVFSWLNSFRWMKEAGVIVAVLIVLASNYGVSDRSRNLLAYDYGMNILKTVEEDAVIFAEGDNTVLPLSYLLYVEGVRPDVTLYERGGILSHELYGIDYVTLEPAEHEARRREVELEVVEEGRPVYYTTRENVALPGYMLEQTGLVYLVVEEGEGLPDRDYWSPYDYRQIWDTTIHLDYMSRNIKAIYYTRLAEHYLDGDRNRALKLLEELKTMLPYDMGVRYDIGNLLLAEGDYRGAVDEFKSVLSENPRNAKAQNNLGYAYALLGERENARRHYMNALKIDPTYLRARFNLAGLLMTEGRLNDAAEQYTLIVSEDPEYAMAYLNLGVIYYNSGDYGGAADAWRTYLELAPNDQNARQIREQLAEMGASG